MLRHFPIVSVEEVLNTAKKVLMIQKNDSKGVSAAVSFIIQTFARLLRNVVTSAMAIDERGESSIVLFKLLFFLSTIMHKNGHATWSVITCFVDVFDYHFPLKFKYLLLCIFLITYMNIGHYSD